MIRRGTDVPGVQAEDFFAVPGWVDGLFGRSFPGVSGFAGVSYNPHAAREGVIS
jgi:hypothetical protein